MGYTGNGNQNLCDREELSRRIGIARGGQSGEGSLGYSGGVVSLELRRKLQVPEESLVSPVLWSSLELGIARSLWERVEHGETIASGTAVGHICP
jgi:hypothetical protein